MVTAIERHSGFGRVVTGSLRPKKPQQLCGFVNTLYYTCPQILDYFLLLISMAQNKSASILAHWKLCTALIHIFKFGLCVARSNTSFVIKEATSHPACSTLPARQRRTMPAPSTATMATMATTATMATMATMAMTATTAEMAAPIRPRLGRRQPDKLEVGKFE